MVFRAQPTTRDYIRAEGDFHKEIYSSKDQKGREKTVRTESKNGELFIVERAIKTEIDTRTEL